jgi:hypothetical protein
MIDNQKKREKYGIISRVENEHEVEKKTKNNPLRGERALFYCNVEHK